MAKVDGGLKTRLFRRGGMAAKAKVNHKQSLRQNNELTSKKQSDRKQQDYQAMPLS
jgi:hypothetical protein